MRLIFTFLLFCTSLFLRGQEINLPIDSISKSVTYSKIIKIKGLNKDSLFNRGKSWFYSFYKNPKGVIKEENKENYRIVGKSIFNIYDYPDKDGYKKYYGQIQYTINTQYKDERVKIEITNINLKSTSYFPIEKWLDKNSPYYSKKNYYYLQQIDEELRRVIKEFESYLTKENIKLSDDW